MTSGSSGSKPEGNNCHFLLDPEVTENFKDDKQITFSGRNLRMLIPKAMLMIKEMLMLKENML